MTIRMRYLRVRVTAARGAAESVTNSSHDLHLSHWLGALARRPAVGVRVTVTVAGAACGPGSEGVRRCTGARATPDSSR